MPVCDTGACGLGGWGGPLPGDPSNDLILSVVGAYGGIDVSWSFPSTNPFAVSHVRVYRGTNANFASAVKIAEVGGSYYFDRLTDHTNPYYYWIQQISINGTLGALIGPGSAISQAAVLDLLDKLAGQITSSQLAVALRAEVDSLPTLRGDLLSGIASLQEADATLSGAFQALDTAVDNAVAFTSAEAVTRAGETSALAIALDAASLIAAESLSDETDARVDAVASEARARLAGAEASAEALLRSVLAQESAALNSANAVALARQEIKQDIVAGVSAEASARLLLATRLDTADAVTTALVLNEASARSTAIAAEATQRDLLAAQFRGTYTGSDLAAVTEGLIYQERVARATENTALSQQITLLSAGSGEQFDWASIWYFDAGVEGWTGNGTPTFATGFLRPADQASGAYVVSPSGLALDGVKYTQVRLRVRKVGTVTWGGYLYWKNPGDTTWDNARRTALTEPTWDVNGIGLVTVTLVGPGINWGATIDQVRVDLASAQTVTDYMEMDWFAIGRPSPGASSAQLLSIQNVQTGINEAMAEDILTLNAQVNNATTGLPAAHSLITVNYTTLADADTAQATATSLLQARVGVTELDIAAAEAAIETNYNTLVAADEAEAEARLTLSAAVNDVNTGLPKTRADLAAFQLAQADQNSASARDVRSLQVYGQASDEAVLQTILNGEQTKAAVSASIALARQELNTDIIVGLAAEATARLTLAAVVNSTSALLQSEQTTRAANDFAIAADVLTLDAQVNNASTGLPATRATLLNDYYTVATTDSAIAAASTSMRAYIDNGARTFRQATFPTRRGVDPVTNVDVPIVSGDIWFDTDDSNRPYIAYVSGGSLEWRSNDTTFAQPAAPSNPQAGSLWIDTDDGNQLYRWNGSSWVSVRDASIATVDARINTVETTKIGYCTIGGAATDHTTRATCEGAGGTWNVGLPISQAVKQVSVSDGASAATLESRFTAQKTLNDGLKAQQTIKLDVNGHVSGYGVYADSEGGSEFIANVAKFAVTTPDGAIPVWVASEIVTLRSVRRLVGTDSKMLVCKTAGTTGSVAPDITGGIGVRVTDGTVVWQIASRVPFAVLGVPVTLNGESLGPGVQIDGGFVQDGTLYVEAARVLGQLTAGQIDTRGLLVRNAEGQVILGSGATVDPAGFMAVPSGWLNSNQQWSQVSGTENVETLSGAQAKADAALAAADIAAQAKATLAEITAKAYADGIVDAAEAAAILDATTKANAAQAAAIAAAAVDATAKADLAATTAQWVGVAGSGKPADNATVGAQAGVNLRDSVGSVLGDSAIKNSSISFTVNANGTISVTGGPASSGSITLTGLGAGAMATINQITSLNVGTYIAAAAINLANINVASIGTLAALSSYLGTVEIAAGGYLRSGKTAWTDNANSGFWQGWIGSGPGEPGIIFGDSTAYMRYRPSTGLELKLNLFSATTSGSLGSSFANGSQPYGSLTASTTGGVGTITYLWSLVTYEGGVLISSGANNATVYITGAAVNNTTLADLTCTATDSNGRVARVVVAVGGTHGTPA